MPQEPIVEPNEELEDIEIAELANKQLKEKDKEIAKLKKDLAKQKLLSNAEEEEEELMSREDCTKTLLGNTSTSYDIFCAAIGLYENEEKEGVPHSFGPDAERVYEFMKECVEDCDGDKNRFHAVYQSKIGPDDASIAMAYRNRNLKK